MPQESDQSATGLLDSVESRISHRTALCSRNILIYGSQRPLTLFAELNDTALYGSQRQVLGHAVSSKTKYVKELKKEKYSPQKKCGESFV
ncbi:hypothetical protein QMM87_16955 [Leptospira santarosai]|uniref:hypothetical protein n=1 Tax=Leptospira santarosai TaxID=28183 RepID=UPI0024AFFDD9|nr:hypothetical protein [Leptospira santarosai]MDI7230332.1 hypothetical protein [Leptospira santarosai]